jgi:hypothetical protein
MSDKIRLKIKDAFDGITEWSCKKKAKRLYRRLWKANEIILHERHSSLNSKDNVEFWAELEECADAIEGVICIVRKRF